VILQVSKSNDFLLNQLKEKSDDDQYENDHQEDMNEISPCIETKSQKPKNE